MRKPAPLMERFWQKVSRPDTPSLCWLWTASLDSSGYGTFNYGGKIRKAHRIAWETENGQIPHGMQIHHRCDVPRCVNPGHLWLGSQAENIADMVSKGRQRARAGGKHPNATCLRPIARRVLRLYASGKYTQAEIATRVGISQPSVSRVVRNAHWTTPAGAPKRRFKRERISPGVAAAVMVAVDAGNESQASIARRMGLSNDTVSVIASGSHWTQHLNTYSG